MGIDCTDVLAAALGLDEAFHDFLALGAGEVAGRRAGDGDIGMRCDGFLEALLAVDGGRGTRRALEFHDLAVLVAHRSDERRVGKECVSTCRSRWLPDHSKKKKITPRSSETSALLTLYQ